MQGCVSPCMNVQGHARECESMYRGARAGESMQERARACEGIQCHVIVKVCEDMQGLARVYDTMRGHRGHGRTYKRVQGCETSCKCL